jgi:hypothetical protein
MNNYRVTYNHINFKPSSYDLLQSQSMWVLNIKAISIEEAKEILKSDHNKNPFYFNIEERHSEPKERYTYQNNRLWICGIGLVYHTLEEAETVREKKHERPYTFTFFNALWYANIPRFDYKGIIKRIE